MITAQQVKELREKTGAGMMDCKNALQKASGDFIRAEKILKEQGTIAASKRSSRTTNEGRIFIAEKNNRAAILELSCETDFVARNKSFISLGNTLAERLAEEDVAAESLNAQLLEAASIIKENLQLRRYEILQKDNASSFYTYIHGEAGNIGSIIQLQAEDPSMLLNTQVQNFAFDCTLHAAAFKPLFLSIESIPESYIKEQKDIFMAQTKNLNKPENILAGIVEGKLRKHYNEICFLEQPFVKDDKFSVRKKADEIMKETTTSFSITTFKVFSVGEE